MAEELITELPDEYYDKASTEDAHDKALREMVNQHPQMFSDNIWDKYREKPEEEE